MDCSGAYYKGLGDSLPEHPSPEWIFLCLVRWSWRMKVFPHSSHSYLLSSWCTRKWSLRGRGVEEHWRRGLGRNHGAHSPRGGRAVCSQLIPFRPPFQDPEPFLLGPPDAGLPALLTSSNKHSALPRLAPLPDDTASWPFRSSVYFTKPSKRLGSYLRAAEVGENPEGLDADKWVGARGTHTAGGQWQPVIRGALSENWQRG